tara:strand:- start:102 stop:326 length:225 start_codon:yes stop_codon:yes gene_type:complete
MVTITIFLLRNLDRLNKEYKRYDYNPIVSLNYKFIGGDEKFYFRYNSHLKDRLIKYDNFKILGKKFIYLNRENY